MVACGECEWRKQWWQAKFIDLSVSISAVTVSCHDVRVSTAARTAPSVKDEILCSFVKLEECGSSFM